MTAQYKFSASRNVRPLVICLAAGLFFVLCWKNLYLEGLIPLDGNVMRFMYPHWVLFRNAVQSPAHLLWNPWNNMGEPLLADPGSMAVYPVLWILALLPHYLTYFQAWVALHTAIGVVAVGLLAWRWYKDRTAAWAAGLVFGFNGFITSRASLTMHFASAAYLPVILYFLESGSALGAGAAFALQWTAGFPSFSYISILLAVGFAFLKKGETPKCLLQAGAWALALSAVQWLPFLEMLRHSDRGVFLSSDSATLFSLSPGQLLKELLLPQWYAFRPGVEGDPAIVSFYVGLGVLGLAAWGARKGSHQEKKLGWGVLAMLLLTLGNHLPGYSHLLPLHVFRFPANWFLGATLGLALLCAAGIRRLPTRKSKTIALGVIALDLLIFAQHTRTAWSQPVFLEQPPKLAQIIQTQTHPGRIYHSERLYSLWPRQGLQNGDDYLGMKNLLSPSYGTAFGIPEARSYQVLRSRRAAAFQERLEKADQSSLLWKKAGISLVVQLNPSATHIDPTQIQIWQNKHPLPLLYFEQGAAGRILTTHVEPGYADMAAHVKTPTRLVFQEVYFPGWAVTVDAATYPPELAEDTFMAVSLPEGIHQVTFRYNPRPFRIGLTISILAIIALLVRVSKRWV